MVNSFEVFTYCTSTLPKRSIEGLVSVCRGQRDFMVYQTPL